jgi:hypothetical protein
MTCFNAPELNLTSARPVWRRYVILALVIFSNGVVGEVLDPRNATDVCFKLRPKGDEQLDALREKNDVQKSNTDISSTQLSSQSYHEDDQNRSDSCDNHVQNKRQPSLHRKKQVKWTLTAIEERLRLLLNETLPPKRANSGQALQYFVELGVERRLGFQVEETKLARRVEVELLYEVDADTNDWEGYSCERRCNGDEGHLADAENEGCGEINTKSADEVEDSKDCR